MMEQIVRPFQSPTTLAAGRAILSVQRQPITPAELRWGDIGTLPTPVEEDGTGVNFNVKSCDKTYTESGRNTNTVRVENPSDSSQYVMVQRINQISFKNPDTSAQQPTPFSYVAFNVTTAMADFAAGFDNSLPGGGAQQCNSTYKLNW